MGYGTFRCTVLEKRKWLTGGNGITKTFVGHMFAVYTFLTKEKTWERE